MHHKYEHTHEVMITIPNKDENTHELVLELRVDPDAAAVCTPHQHSASQPLHLLAIGDGLTQVHALCTISTLQWLTLHLVAVTLLKHKCYVTFHRLQNDCIIVLKKSTMSLRQLTLPQQKCNELPIGYKTIIIRIILLILLLLLLLLKEVYSARLGESELD